MSFVLGGVIAPIGMAWIKGDGWLQRLGFKDTTGSSVIFLCGGLCGLVGNVMLKPRFSIFNKNGKKVAKNSIKMQRLIEKKQRRDMRNEIQNKEQISGNTESSIKAGQVLSGSNDPHTLSKKHLSPSEEYQATAVLEINPSLRGEQDLFQLRSQDVDNPSVSANTSKQSVGHWLDEAQKSSSNQDQADSTQQPQARANAPGSNAGGLTGSSSDNKERFDSNTSEFNKNAAMSFGANQEEYDLYADKQNGHDLVVSKVRRIHDTDREKDSKVADHIENHLH